MRVETIFEKSFSLIMWRVIVAHLFWRNSRRMQPANLSRKWFFRKPDDEKLKRNEEGDVDLYSEPFLCLSLLSFFPCIIGLVEEPYFITSHLDAIALGLTVVWNTIFAHMW